MCNTYRSCLLFVMMVAMACVSPVFEEHGMCGDVVSLRDNAVSLRYGGAR